jgi:hypothetical protein
MPASPDAGALKSHAVKKDATIRSVERAKESGTTASRGAKQ